MLSRLPSVFHRLARSQLGVTIVEYSLLVALISVTCVAVLNDLGQRIQNVLDAVVGAMS
jgi:Flp pilus assembly pilin Flp